MIDIDNQIDESVMVLQLAQHLDKGTILAKKIVKFCKKQPTERREKLAKMYYHTAIDDIEYENKYHGVHLNY